MLHALRALAVTWALAWTIPPAALITGCAAPTGLSAADHQAIAALLDEQRRAWNRGDLDGFMAAYEPTAELVFTSGGEVRRGWQVTRDRYRQRYGEQPATTGELDFELMEVQELGADGAIVLGRWRLIETAQAGSGIFSLGLRRGPLGWKIVHDHTSSAPAPAPEPEPEPAPAE